MPRSTRTPGVRVDGLEPSIQSPKKKATLGTPDNPWGVCYATSGVFQHVQTTNISGIVSYDASMFKSSLSPADVSFLVEHNLNVECVDVIVIDDVGDRIQPNTIKVVDFNTVLVEFVEPQSGTVLIQKGK